MVFASPSTPGRVRGPAGRLYRGSQKRLRRIKWRQHTPIDFWILLASLLALLGFFLSNLASTVPR